MKNLPKLLDLDLQVEDLLVRVDRMTERLHRKDHLRPVD